MSLPEPSLNILLINEHPEEIKLVTTTLRNFFSGCRIEAGYTSEDALTFSQQGDWHIILIDQELAPERGMDVIARLRRHAPHAAILLQTNDHDSHTALQALQNGADFLLLKQSPGFITELLFSVQEAVEKRDLQMKLDHTFQRHLRFIETLSDLLYELDAEGRFVYVGAAVTALLGYTPEELAGRHYSILLAPQHEQLGRFRLNERRAGSRSTRKLEITLHRKPRPDTPTLTVPVEVTAKGIFDSTNRYLGTVGLLHDLSHEKAQQDRLAELESRLRESDRQLTLTREAARVSRQLQQPLTTLLQDSQRLLTSIQHSRIEQHVETMIAKASRANQLSHHLAQVISAHPVEFIPLNLNDILQTVAQSIHQAPDGAGIVLTSQLGQQTPAILGSPTDLENLVHILIGFARRCVSTPHLSVNLTIETGRLENERPSIAQHNRPAQTEPTRTFASFSIRAAVADMDVRSTDESPETMSAEQLLQAHTIVQAHGGSIHIEHPGDRQLTISVCIPAMTDRSSQIAQPERQTTVSKGLSRVPMRGGEREQKAARVQPERRRSERTRVSLPVQLSIGGSTLRGVLRNMSTGGALVTIRDNSTSIHLQPAYIVIKTPVSFLELQGVVHERPSDTADASLPDLKEFAITFLLNVEQDRNVLRSLLDGLQDGSTTISFEGLILPTATSVEPHTPTLPSFVQPATERRETTRLRLIYSVQLVAPHNPSHRLVGQFVNLSLDGACLELPAGIDSTESHLALHLFPLEPAGPSSERHEPHASRQPWNARVVWSYAQRRSARPVGQSGHAATCIGVRFDRLSPAQEHELRRIIADHSNLFHEHFTPRPDSPILTESRTVQNHEGYQLALSYDHSGEAATEQVPLILLCPGYGTTQQQYVAVAYAMAAAGLRVLRYDHSRHIGLSEGDPSHTTFTSMEDDLDSILTYTHTQWPNTPLTLLASDLLGRIALRRQDWQRRLHRLILLNPTLDLRSCLSTLHQRDLVQEHLTGTRLGLGNLLGLPLDIDHFLADAVASQYTNIAALHEDLSHCATDVVILTTAEAAPDIAIPEPSPAVLSDAMNQLGSRARKVSLSPPTPTAGGLTPSLLTASSQQLLQLCQPGHGPKEPSPIAAPTLSHTTAARARVELDRLRIKYSLGAAGRERLWKAYSDVASTLDDLPAHWHTVDQLYQLLQPFDGNLTILDVGCGLHSFARLLLLNLSYHLRAQTRRPGAWLHYVGTDFSPMALQQAREATGSALHHVEQLFSGRMSGATPIHRQWALSRSAEALPFADHSFDRIVANLSLTFAHSPLHVLRELFRVLKPGGKLVISAFTPSADVARLYRRSLPELGLDAFTGEARTTLNRMGQCCMALRIGQLHTMEEEALIGYLAHVTPAPPRLLRALSGQLLLAAAEKPDSAG